MYLLHLTTTYYIFNSEVIFLSFTYYIFNLTVIFLEIYGDSWLFLQ